MGDSPPGYLSLEDVAEVVLPARERPVSKRLSGGEECLLYLRLANDLREATMPDCRRIGHLPVRSMGCAMRDNGSRPCSISS